MKLEYAEIIHDIVQRGIDTRYLAILLARCDTKQVYDLVEKLDNAVREYDYISNTCKDSTIKEVSLFPVADRIGKIQKEIEEL